MKTVNKTTYVCVPSSKIGIIQDALKKDQINDIEFYRGRHKDVQHVSMDERSRTFKKILDNCPSIELERNAFAAEHMTRNFVGVLSIILVSQYDEDDLTNYCISAING